MEHAHRVLPVLNEQKVITFLVGSQTTKVLSEFGTEEFVLTFLKNTFQGTKLVFVQVVGYLVVFALIFALNWKTRNGAV